MAIFNSYVKLPEGRWSILPGNETSYREMAGRMLFSGRCQELPSQKYVEQVVSGEHVQSSNHPKTMVFPSKIHQKPCFFHQKPWFFHQHVPSLWQKTSYFGDHPFDANWRRIWSQWQRQNSVLWDGLGWKYDILQIIKYKYMYMMYMYLSHSLSISLPIYIYISPCLTMFDMFGCMMLYIVNHPIL